MNEKQKNCPYCHTTDGNNDAIDLIATKQEDPMAGALIYIWKDRLRYEADTHNISRRIYYCPMCGRDLRSDEKFHQAYREEESNGKSIDKSPTSGD